MKVYTKATLEGEVQMTPEEMAYWDSKLAEQAAAEALRAVENSEPVIPTTTL